MTQFLRTLTHVFASRIFFAVVIGFFVIQASWFVLTALYPMAFDEEFHFGIIKLYAEQWSPFMLSHPAGGDAFGAVARDPSYLFHYLMSFPYRLLEQLTASETTRIIVLRFINVALFAYALVLFRKVLLRITRSNAFTNVSLAILTLVPIVPQLAAHINYDNLQMVMVAWACLLVTDIHRQFNAGRFDIRTVTALACVCLLASIIKYTFLPIFIGIILFVIYDAFRSFASWHAFWSRITENWLILSTKMRIGLAVLFLLCFGLFFQRFGINTIQYHTPIPSCEKVLAYENCKSYGPWIRDYNLSHSKGDVDENPIAYSFSWLRGLWWRLFFAVNSMERDYANYPPLPIPSAAAVIVIGTIAALTLALWRRMLAGHPLVLFCGIVVSVYCGILFAENYAMFRETGQPVAINGRYLIPIIPLIAIIGWRALSIALKRIPQAKPVVALAVLLCFLQGGGVFTYILRSDSSWNWPQSSAAVTANDKARVLLDPFIFQGTKSTNGKQP